MSNQPIKSELALYIEKHLAQLIKVVVNSERLKDNDSLLAEQRVRLAKIAKYDIDTVARLAKLGDKLERMRISVEFDMNFSRIETLQAQLNDMKAVLDRTKAARRGNYPISSSGDASKHKREVKEAINEAMGQIRLFDDIVGNIECLQNKERIRAEEESIGQAKQRELHMSLLRLQTDAPDYRGALLDLYEDIIYEFGDLTSDSLKNDVTRLVNDLKKTEVHNADVSASQSEYQELLDSIQKHRH